MNNLMIFLAFFGLLLLHSCTHQNSDESGVVNTSDTAILIASNNPVPNLENEESNIPIQKAAENSKIESQRSLKTNEQPKEPVPDKMKKEIDEVQREVLTEPMKFEEMVKNEELGMKNEEDGMTGGNNKNLENEVPAKVEFNHEMWDQLLKKYVSASGKVNYKGFKTEKTELDAYLKNLENNPIQDNWSKAKKMVYWINAYNAFTIKMIVDNYPVSSITKLHGGKPWDVKWIKLNGQTYNLNNIENDILRPQFKDARIHFAINCAAQSCPPLLNQAWTESNLDQLLERQTKAFINNPNFNTIKSNEVEISKIFEWYAVDFGNIVDFLNKYSTTKINKNAKVKYKEYNWNLNE